MKVRIVLLFLLAVLLNGVLMADLKFFWLDRPRGRDNPHDPGSPLYLSPTPRAPLGTATVTPTFSLTPTYSVTQTLTVSPTPLGTLTDSPTASLTPTISATFTVSPTPTTTPMAPSTATPTLTPCGAPPCHGPLVADFEEPDNSVDLWGGTISTSSSGSTGSFTGAFASTISPNPWTSTSASSGGNPSNCGCVSGSVGQQASPWPWTSFMIALNSTPGTDVNIAPYVVNNGLTFDYKATVANVGYDVRLRQQTVDATTGSAPYIYQFTPGDTNWHTLTVYFPGDGNGNPEFAQPSWATAVTFTAMAYGVEFIPVGSAGGASNYGLCVDNVTFNSPVAVVAPKIFENFEDSAYNGSSPPPSYLTAQKVPVGGTASYGPVSLETTNLVPGESGHAITETITLGASTDWVELDCLNGPSFGGNVDMSAFKNFVQFSAYIDNGPVDVAPAIYDGTTFCAYQGPPIKLTAGAWQTFKVALNATNFANFAAFNFTTVHTFAVTVGADPASPLPLNNANFYCDDLEFTQ